MSDGTLHPTDRAEESPRSWDVLFDLWLLKQAVYPLIDQAISRTKLSADDFGLYLMVGDFQPVSPGDIATYSGMRANTVSAAIQRMDRRGHVVRTPNEHDGRSILVALSDTGLAVTAEAIDAARLVMERLDPLMDIRSGQQAIERLNDAVRVLANLPPRVRPTEQQDPSWNMLLYDLWLLKQASYPLIEQAIDSTGLSAEELGLYLLIGEFQPVSPRGISRNSGMRPNTVSATLQRLESRGHIARQPNENDGRSILVTLTEEGLRTTHAAAAGNQLLLDRLGDLIDVGDAQLAIDQVNQAVRRVANLPPRLPSAGSAATNAAPTGG